MRRVVIICEGETEKEFCNTILAPFFAKKRIFIQSPLIKKSMGGVVKWVDLKKDILHYLKNDRNVYVTTLIDYYGTSWKHDFPKWDEAEKEADKNIRMNILEQGMSESIGDTFNNRFIPYIQLHEFEGLLFNDINIFHEQIPASDLIGIKELKATFSQFSNPEMINNNRETSPSHRLERIISGYNKIVYGNILAEAIGLQRIRNKSPRFNNWIKKLENLNN